MTPKTRACFLTKTTVPSGPGTGGPSLPLALPATPSPAGPPRPVACACAMTTCAFPFFFFLPLPLPWRLRSAALGLVPGHAAVYGGTLLGQRAAGSASLVRELPTRFSARLPWNSVALSVLARLLHSANSSSFTSSRSAAPARLAPHSRRAAPPTPARRECDGVSASG